MRCSPFSRNALKTPSNFHTYPLIISRSTRIFSLILLQIELERVSISLTASSATLSLNSVA